MALVKALTVWALFFLICFGLGYPTLNRYDPAASGGNFDAGGFYRMIEQGIRAEESLLAFRVLTPVLAGPVYRLAKGRVGSWNPARFSLLVVNAFFCATSAFVLYRIGLGMIREGPAAVLAGLLYLCNFTVVNGQLAGLVDAGEACGMLLLTWLLLEGRWGWLPLLAVVGALNKETFLPLSLAFSGAWWLSTAAQQPGRGRRLLCWLAMGLSGITTLSGVQTLVMRELIWPWQVIPEMRIAPVSSGFMSWFASPSFWYPFLWVLPLGLFRLKELPKPWRLATGAACAVAVAGGTHYGVGGNLGRVLFDIAGGALSLSTALLLADLSQLPGR